MPNTLIQPQYGSIQGISPDHPDLLYRSDLLENPIPIPKGRHPHPHTKTAYGVFNTPLNAVWDTVAPQIRQLLKTRGIRYSAIKAARFVTHGEGGNDTIGPIVIWISTHPATTTAENAHDASPDILALLRANGVEGAVVEWYEGAAEKLSGPHLLGVTNREDPTCNFRRFLTAALGIPIATAEREAADAQGSVALFFHENKDERGAPSAKVFGVSNCHVRRLATDAKFFAEDILEFQAKPMNPDPVQATMDDAILESMQERLAKLEKDTTMLGAFYDNAESQWGDIAHRNIGHVDWAPKISIDVQGRSYTRDIGTFEVDAVKFKAQFKGNVVDLGAF